MASPFLELPREKWVAWNDLAFAIRDGFPVSPGHTLVITRREVRTWFDATREERQAVLDLVEQVKQQLDSELSPQGYNVGFNVNEAAGQTVMHLHVHVIPRYRGDMDDPRGGVRHVIPWKGNYRREPAPALSTGGTADPFLEHLRPLFARAARVDVVAAFIQDSGLTLLEASIAAVAARGAHVRLVTGDYLNITQAEALCRLLDWQEALRSDSGGTFTARVIETERLPGPTRSFHPKSWHFEDGGFGVVFVGSSNVSHSALATGIEWNLRLERGQDREGYLRAREAFERLWGDGRPLTFDWVAEYSRRARIAATPLPPGEALPEEVRPAPPPHEVQVEALRALAEARAQGRKRALVVMATGLGKTLLAALDADQHRMSSGRERTRVLFVAHRRELLGQAADTFRRVLRPSVPDLRVGWCEGDRVELEADVVVASIQKLSRPENVGLLAERRFDYAVVDEVHHADAPTYRRILGQLRSDFTLGLTATPDRADEGDILGLFDDHLAFRADLDVGIEAGLLVPFAYFGLKDVVDYQNIPWRNRQFDAEELAAAVQTQARMERLWEGWGAHPGTRTLVFCCSIGHAEYVRSWLEMRGVRIVAVYAREGSADREHALRQLSAGELDAVCAVDLFNEGVDVPTVDRIVMLRPTESPVLFLQQLGRGLRLSEGKDRLTVIDFVGNHRVFLNRLRTLLSFGSGASLGKLIATGKATGLPPGCSVDVELEAIELLPRIAGSGRNEVERVYRELTAARGRRPTMGELLRMGYTPSTLRGVHGSWFEFVAAEGHLDDPEWRVLESALDWFREVETSQVTKCFKMVLLEALDEAEAFRSGLGLAELARRSHEILARSPELLRDIVDVREIGNPDKPDPATWLAYWRRNPVAAWCGTAERPGRWFRTDGTRLTPRLPIPEGLDETFADMTRELVDYRLAQYRRRARVDAQGAAFTCKIISNKRDPILKLPSRKARPDLPQGDVDVRLEDGSIWRFRFMKEFINVARPAGRDRNELPDLCRRWFGPAAGRQGTAFEARFSRSPDGWWVEPVGRVVELPGRGILVAYPTLRAVAGAAGSPSAETPEAEHVKLPVRTRLPDVFAVRATGSSMDGPPAMIRDGDWLVMRYARGTGLGAVENRVALVQTAADGDHTYQVKRIARDRDSWLLRSDNPAINDVPATEETVPVALLVEAVKPEALAPELGTVLDEDEVRRWFEVDGEIRTGRFGGHLLLVVAGPSTLSAPDRVPAPVPDRRPGETAFVLARIDDEKAWRYCGVGRWTDEDGAWAIPEVDFATWRALGRGRSSSRRLPVGAEDDARSFIGRLLEQFPAGTVIDVDGRRCRILERANERGVRIDGGPGGFTARVVSLTDIAWVLTARRKIEDTGGVLDEARVNRERYLEGTPRGSTRWIDTEWALHLVRAISR
jgi:superfamily II DNA or RNA helicase/diadenosine tetraphosphate (Ap4A) HIT family hydrolase/SOS-response transcriptional repressor LexA